MAMAKRHRLDSYRTCTVSNQECDRTADGAQPRMLAQSLKQAFKTRPKVRPPVPPLWLERKAIAYSTCTVSNLTELLTLKTRI